MRGNSIRIIARFLWLAPALLVALAIYQADVARDLRATLQNGQPATARITDFESSDRADITYDYVSLAVDVDGRTIVREKLSLPHSFVPLVEGRQELDVIVDPGADQEIVIRDLGRAQSRMAAINAVMALVAALLVGVGIGAWQRLLRRKGDPALANPAETHLSL